MEKYVYLFQEGNVDMKELLGGKGAGLAEMTRIGLPVPQGFTVTTEACLSYYREHMQVSEEIQKQIFDKIIELEQITGKKMGDPANPLLVSVRSGARVSMPGMMDTILNLGLNDTVCAGFIEATQNPRFVYDSYRRFIMMYADVVKGYERDEFEHILSTMKEEKGVTSDLELDSEDLKQLTDLFQEKYEQLAGTTFPQDPREQLLEAITAVFRSWNNERAIYYRKMNQIPNDWGTAVNVQEMVYGNRGDNCGTGVAFTRNPATGENHLYGEYLINAQGEDVVAGIRTPESIDTLKEKMPAVYQEFERISKLLESHYRDMQDMEFTIENKKLYMLQTRSGKRTAAAALKVAVDMVSEGMITKEEALLRINPDQLDQLLHPSFDLQALHQAIPIAKGLAASPGAASGKICFQAKDVTEMTKQGEHAILVRIETSPEDIEGMNHAEGIVTIHGGMTSHAAVVARGMGRCCVCGCSELVIDLISRTLTAPNGQIFHEGDILSIDGSTGFIYGGEIPTKEATISGDFETFMHWADEARTLGVRANADTPRDALQAKKFGAEGIGLCRTEHMFFDEKRIFLMRKMITSETVEQRKEALNQLLPIQRNDFEQLFEVMEGAPVTIRYLDPPLHEFLPKTEKEMTALAVDLNMTVEQLHGRIEQLKEFNPMMGHRGLRLDITYPEIAEMQTRAVLEAAIQVKQRGIPVLPEIMIPLSSDSIELQYVKNIITTTAETIFQETGNRITYHVGTMIELPRACILADKIAKDASFFSFGTNDLTQMCYGFSRDDAGKFLEDYYQKHIFEKDPFKTIDQQGVGALIEMAIAKGKSVRPDIALGICGEHGGEKESVAYCHKIGLTYVSCSPYRIPIARLAAAQAAIKEGMHK